MNKNIKRFVSVLLAVLVLSALGAGALAEDGDTYIIRIFAGNVEGATVSQSEFNVPYGTTITYGKDFTASIPAESQYYIKGIRESGLDNNQLSNNTIYVTEDADYVVAYGIRGQLVAYTVSYVDEAGNALAPSETYYGNVGDKPVIAYVYIDGYEPQAYNLTRTLSENEAANVFTFVYSQIILPTPVPAEPAPTPYVYTEGAEGGGAAGGAAAGGGLPAGAGGAELPGAGGEEAVEGEEVPEAGGPAAAGEQPAAETQNEPAPAQQEAAQEPAAEQVEENETPQASGPREIIDLDEEDTPLGSAPEVKEKPQTELQKEREQTERKFYIAAGLLGVSLIAIVALVVALVRRRKA